MTSYSSPLEHRTDHPVDVVVQPATAGRDRVTTAFRIILAIPHLLLVGGPLAFAINWSARSDPGDRGESSASSGILGIAACVVAIISWFAILFTGRQPTGLRDFTVFFLRWRTRAIAYEMLLRDEYPPFGEGAYPATFDIGAPPAERDRLTVAFRIFLAIPHFIVLWALGIGWAIATIVAWFAILFTGSYPEGMYRFSTGVLRWSMRVEAYMYLLHDAYPPFTLD